jgi:hypothetical protein
MLNRSWQLLYNGCKCWRAVSFCCYVLNLGTEAARYFHQAPHFLIELPRTTTSAVLKHQLEQSGKVGEIFFFENKCVM